MAAGCSNAQPARISEQQQRTPNPPTIPSADAEPPIQTAIPKRSSAPIPSDAIREGTVVNKSNPTVAESKQASAATIKQAVNWFRHGPLLYPAGSRGAPVAVVEYSQLDTTPDKADCGRQYCSVVVAIEQATKYADTRKHQEFTATGGILLDTSFDPDGYRPVFETRRKQIKVRGNDAVMTELYADETRAKEQWQMHSNINLRTITWTQTVGGSELQFQFLADSVRYTEEENVAFVNSWEPVSS